MRHIVATLLALAASLAAAGETKLTVKGPEGLEGKATLVNKTLEDGTKYVRLTMQVRYPNGQAADVLQESSYTKEGIPVRMLQTTRSVGKKVSTSVTFSDEGAQVVTDKGDGPKANMVVSPEGSIANPTEFWFVRDQPQVGHSVEYFTFRLSEQAWAKTKTRYEGLREIVVAGKRVKAHLVLTGEMKTYLDGAGDPYRIELSGLTMERE